MNEDIKYTLSEHWKIPDELLSKAYELVQKYGVDLVSEYFDSHEEHTLKYFEELEKYIQNEICFEAKSWDEMNQILNEIFQFSELDAFGLFDVDDLYNKIDKNRLFYFYEFKEDKTNKKVICCKGSNVSKTKQQWIEEGYKKWQKYQNLD